MYKKSGCFPKFIVKYSVVPNCKLKYPSVFSGTTKLRIGVIPDLIRDLGVLKSISYCGFLRTRAYAGMTQLCEPYMSEAVSIVDSVSLVI